MDRKINQNSAIAFWRIIYKDFGYVPDDLYGFVMEYCDTLVFGLAVEEALWAVGENISESQWEDFSFRYDVGIACADLFRASEEVRQCAMVEREREDSKRHAKRRKKDVAKALRKRNICRKAYGYEWYGNLHAYSKNKIHCSCSMCAEKTSAKELRGNGARSGHPPAIPYGETCNRKGKRWKYSDEKKIEHMMHEEFEWANGE